MYMPLVEEFYLLIKNSFEGMEGVSFAKQSMVCKESA